MALPIYEGRDFYVPRFEVVLSDRPVGDNVARDITQVTYREDLEKIDEFELTVNNWDAETRDFKYVDRDLFDPGKKVVLSMGYFPKTPTRMVTGEITSLKPSFPTAGQPTLTVSGLNLLHRFRRSQVSRAYVQKRDSEIAQEIAKRVGADIDAPNKDNEPVWDYLLQENQYDIVFLMNRARRIGYDLFVTEGSGSASPKLSFKPSSDVRDVTYKLTYGRSLVQFDPTLTTARQVGKVTVRGWDSRRGEPIAKTVTRDELTGDRSLTGDMRRAVDDREEVITDHPVHTDDEAVQLARETLTRIVNDMVTARVSTIGLPEIRAGTVVEIDGVGERFSGRYFVTSTTHTIGESGYTTEFGCRLQED
jgi:uncharacterized protein